MNRVRRDPYLEELFYDEVAAVRTLQDFLYDFDEDNVRKRASPQGNIREWTSS
jgi:hypothetical protein